MNQIILITGANRGIGKGLAAHYLTQPDTTVIATVREPSANNTKALQALQKAEGSQLLIVSLVLDNPSSATEAISELQTQHGIGHVDTVIANAGICNHWGLVADMADTDVLSHMEVNTLGPLRVFRATASLLQRAETPKFVYISTLLASIANIEQIPSLTAAYGMSKAAGNYLVKKIDVENGHLIAFAIDPGLFNFGFISMVQTDMGSRAAQFHGMEKAPLTIEESVEGITTQISIAEKSTISGQFVSYNGEVAPWMTHLPFEIWCEIEKYIRLQCSEDEVYRTLVILTRVSRSLRAFYLPTVYNTVQLHAKGPQIMLFTRTCVENPKIAAMVQSLSLYSRRRRYCGSPGKMAPYNTDWARDILRQKSLKEEIGLWKTNLGQGVIDAALALLLICLPNLKDLALHDKHCKSFHMLRIMDRIAAKQSPLHTQPYLQHLQRIQIVNEGWAHPIRLDDFFKFFVLPSIRKVVISGVYPCRMSGVKTEKYLPRGSCPVEEISFKDCNGDYNMGVVSCIRACANLKHFEYQQQYIDWYSCQEIFKAQKPKIYRSLTIHKDSLETLRLNDDYMMNSREQYWTESSDDDESGLRIRPRIRPANYWGSKGSVWLGSLAEFSKLQTLCIRALNLLHFDPEQNTILTPLEDTLPPNLKSLLLTECTSALSPGLFQSLRKVLCRKGELFPNLERIVVGMDSEEIWGFWYKKDSSIRLMADQYIVLGLLELETLARRVKVNLSLDVGGRFRGPPSGLRHIAEHDVAGLTASCVQTAKALHDLKDKFDNANLTISAICTETTLISASMSHIQSYILRNPDSVSDKLLNQPSLESTLDQALTGCYIVFDVLQTEVSKLTESELLESSVNLGWSAKVRYIWNEGTMKDILSQMRGLQTALTLLLQLLGVDTITELRQIMDQNTAILSEVAQHTSRISSANRASRAPRSILDMSFKTLSIADDGGSLYSSKLFTFDDDVVNSNVYRQVLAKAYAREGSTAGAGRPNNAMGVESEENKEGESTSGTSTPQTASIVGAGGDSEPRQKAPSFSSSSQTMSVASDPLKELLDDYNRPSHIWRDHWSLTPSDLSSVPRKELLRQESLHEVITTEKHFLQCLQVIRYLYYYRLTFDPVTTLPTKSNWEFAEKNFGILERFYHLHKTFLYEPLITRQSEGPWMTDVSDIFQRWLTEATELYLEYGALFPYLQSAVETEATGNARFAQFLNQSMNHPLSKRLPWMSYMKSPITRIQRYTLFLSVVLKNTNPSNERHKYHDLERANDNIRKVALQCDEEIAKAFRQMQVNKLRAEIGPIGPRIIAPTAEILFDRDFSRKGGFRAATPVRVVVLGSPSSLVLVLVRDSELKRVGEESYEVVKQFNSRVSHPVCLFQTTDDDHQYCLVLSQRGSQSDYMLRTGHIERVEQLIDAIRKILNIRLLRPRNQCHAPIRRIRMLRIILTPFLPDPRPADLGMAELDFDLAAGGGSAAPFAGVGAVASLGAVGLDWG
ncbi:hypothetical protein FE257_007270 [Aspergillus nanangensis]|uniref:DH domain-containing protein n=1 Tax=Aspergillus nanangensis TaxID=2582783 RepID=A0AAD4CN35_ASPNN|nr:hypothetical protein FE257_007270 [Aspergillus nanangensis]